MMATPAAESGAPDASSVKPEGQAFRLPHHPSSFIGREREISVVRGLLHSTRLLTLTGTGGSGKTRLALEVATREQHAFTDGTAWVELAAVSEPELVCEVAGRSLGLRTQPSRAPLASLVDLIDRRAILLILDNCEQVIDACATLADVLLRGCPALTILATSREALAVEGETAWLVPPLSLPGDAATVAEVESSEAGQLFIERASAVRPSFSLVDSNAVAVAQICRALDGIPLALELAAARLRALAPEQVASRLHDRFRLLTGGSRTAVPRHQTLRATIDWSYGLLRPPARLLLDRLSVFSGSFSLEAAETICGAGRVLPEVVLDLLTELVEKSLVEVLERDGIARYRLLETVEQYGRERLTERGEAEELQRRHAEFFLSVAEAAEPHLTSSARSEWLEPLKREVHNFRTGLQWSRGADTELHLRLIGSLRMLWLACGNYREARHWCETALALPDAAVPTRARAAALLTAGAIAAMQMENALGREWLEESERIWRDSGDTRQHGYAQLYLAATRLEVDLDGATVMLRAALAGFRAIGERFGESIVLTALGVALQSRGEHQDATRVLEEAVAAARELRIDHNTALPLQFLGSSLFRQGEVERPISLLREALTSLQRDPEYLYLSRALWMMAAMLIRYGVGADAVRLFGASEALRERIGATLAGFDGAAYMEALAEARSAVVEPAFSLAWSEGRRLDPAQAIDLALAAGDGFPLPHPVAAIVSEPRRTRGVAAAPAVAGLRVRALGPLVVECDGVGLTPEAWRHAKPRELLLYLLCYPEGRTREQIGLALWPEASAAQLRNSFHVALYHLRRALGHVDWVQHERDRYRVNPKVDVAFDAATFEAELTAALMEARAGPVPAERLREALAPYQGDFLDDQVVGDWHHEKRDHLRRRYIEGLLVLGRVLFEAAQYDDAADVYQKILLRENLHEEAQRQLIVCRARIGERTLAMRQYQRFAQLLRDELDAEPDPETTELFELLQRGRAV
jgi:predicted ATPase/DNA-binding SARP family transcriptional activator